MTSGKSTAVSATDDTITQMWYPSYDYFTKNGTLTGVYNYDQNAIDFGNLSPADRIRDASRRRQVSSGVCR